MQKLKEYLTAHFEELFVLIILISVASIYYFATYKLAFLNFFFLPVLMAGTYLGLRHAVIGAFLCVLLVGIYLAVNPDPFLIAQTKLDIYLQVALWGGFLILSGALVGKLYERLKLRIDEAGKLNEELVTTQKELVEANKQLNDYTNNLKSMVEKKTSTLAESKRSVERLKNKVEEVLHMSMDPTVAQMMIEKRLHNEKKRITALMVDLQGFTTYSEQRQPETVIQQLNSFLDDMASYVEAYHAHQDVYTGDGFILEFGSPVDYKNHALLATVCGVRMMEFMRESSYPWKMRIGVSTGPAIMGLIGGTKRRAYTAIGNCMNTSSRLEGLCPPGSMLIDQETFDSVKDYVDSQLFVASERRAANADRESQLAMIKLEDELSRNPGDAKVLVKVAEKFLALGACDRAKGLFDQAMHIEPDFGPAKIGYAEASLQLEKRSQTSIRGKRKAVVVHEILGVKDALDHPNVPPSLKSRYGKAIRKVPFARDLIWPSEAVGGALGSSQRTALFAYAMATQLNMEESERKTLVSAAFLHDIGMSIVPHATLTKESGFSSDDMETIRQHPKESVSLLRKNGYDDPALLECVLNHHQRPDGTGYPLSPEGKPAMPSRISRILSIADSYEALTSDRPWRNKWDPKGALGEMREEAASGKFDQEVFEAFDRMMAEALG